MATRLLPYPIHPPSETQGRSDRPLSADGGISRFDPAQITVPGIEGFGVEIGKIRQERTLLVRVAAAAPFSGEVRSLAKRSLAQWNPIFNTWDIPILSQTKGNALKETWNWIEEAFFEVPWYSEILEVHWRYKISEKSLQGLKARIHNLSHFWTNGVIDYPSFQVDLVYGGLSRQQIEEGAIAAFKELRPLSPWTPSTEGSINRLCVNYLRHRQSSYHVLLKTSKPYLQIFRDINQSIAAAYPWLSHEATRQIEVKQRGRVHA